MAADIIQSTTQQFLDIHDITNNFVIMKDGTVSLIISVDAMNFGLLAEEEQDAVMYAYAGLLNSINYTVQIVIHSQTKDVTSYLQLLKDQESTASNETIRKRIRAYREFVGNLIHDRNVLDKKFYVVIPANSIELGIVGAKAVLPGQSKFDITSVERSLLLERASNILDPRKDHLIAQFARIGLYSRQLTTQEIIQLFYIRYNPEATEGQQIAESNSYTSPLVEANIQGNFMNDTTPQMPAQPGSASSMPGLTPSAPADSNTMPPVTPIQETTPVSASPAIPAASPIETMPNILAAPQAAVTNASTTPTPTMDTPQPATFAWTPPVSTTPLVPATPNTTSATPIMPPAETPAMTSPSMPTSIPNTTASAPINSAMPSVNTMSASTTDIPDDANKIQADLNATVQQLGATPEPIATTPPASPDTTSVAPIMPPAEAAATAPDLTADDATPPASAGPDLPPLPEI